MLGDCIPIDCTASVGEIGDRNSGYDMFLLFIVFDGNDKSGNCIPDKGVTGDGVIGDGGIGDGVTVGDNSGESVLSSSSSSSLSSESISIQPSLSCLIARLNVFLISAVLATS